MDHGGEGSRARVAIRIVLCLAALGTTTSIFAGCTTVDRLVRMPVTAGREAPPLHLEESAKRVGDRAPDFALPSTTGEPIALSEVLADGAAVLVFYRGDW